MQPCSLGTALGAMIFVGQLTLLGAYALMGEQSHRCMTQEKQTGVVSESVYLMEQRAAGAVPYSLQCVVWPQLLVWNLCLTLVIRGMEMMAQQTRPISPVQTNARLVRLQDVRTSLVFHLLGP